MSNSSRQIQSSTYCFVFPGLVEVASVFLTEVVDVFLGVEDGVFM